MPTLLRSKQVKARKAHPCRTCAGYAAQPGDIYTRETYVFDGHVYDWMQCELCISMIRDIVDWAMYTEDGINLDHYADWVDEHPDDPRAIEWLRRATRGEFEAAREVESK